jgi:hypothetical protein
MPKRETKTADEIAEWIVSEVKKHQDCSEFPHSPRILRVKPQDASEANWTTQDGTGDPNDWKRECDEALAKAIAAAKARFDLAPGR